MQPRSYQPYLLAYYLLSVMQKLPGAAESSIPSVITQARHWRQSMLRRDWAYSAIDLPMLGVLQI